MISSTVAVEELNAFILSGIFSFTGLVPDAFVRSASTLLGDAIVQVGYFIVVLSSNCLFWRSICNFHRKKGWGVQCFSYRADPVLSRVLVASQFTFEFDHRGGQLSWKMQEALFNP